MSSDDRRRVRFWRPDSPSVSGMLRVEHEDRLRTTYSDQFLVMLVCEGAFDGWYRGQVRTHTRGAIKLKEPGEVHRDLRVHAPFTLQGAWFSQEIVAGAAASLGLRGTIHFKASGFDSQARAARLAVAMHAALVRPGVPEIERATRVAETLAAVLGDDPSRSDRVPRVLRRARAFLHDGLAGRVTLDELAAHAGLDKFRLVRAFRAEIGLPPYEYLTQVRVAKAKELLSRGARVADAALTVGFCDESQLHRHFRRIVGITPGRWSRSLGGATKRQHRPSAARGVAALCRHDPVPAH